MQSGETHMLQKIALNLTEYSIKQKWIDPTQSQWCQYALEKRLGFIFFAMMCILLAAVIHEWVALFSFVVVFYVFRQKMGGWHAHSFWLCQLISLGTVIVAVVILGPLLEQVKPSVIISLDIPLIAWTYFLKPAYPPALHFSQKIREANTKRKNQMLLWLTIFQLLSLMLTGFSFLIYSILGLAIADLSVLVQMYKKYKKGCINHESH